MGPQVNPNRRTQVLRRDFNDLVRDESGRVSTTKIGTLIGQWLAIKLILQHGSLIIENWDSLAVLFSVLIAPQMLLKMVNMKYGNGHANREQPRDSWRGSGRLDEPR